METEVFYWDEINKRLILKDLIKRKIMIAAVAVTLFFTVMAYWQLTYEPRYTSKATVAVAADASGITYNGLNDAVKYAATYVNGFKGSRMLAHAKEITGINANDISLAAEQISGTNLLIVSASAADQQTAYQIMDAIVNNYSAVIDAMHLSGRSYFVQEASIPIIVSERPGIGMAVVIALAGVCGLAVATVVMSALRGTVKTKACAKRRIGENCSGVITKAAGDESIILADPEKDGVFTDCIYAAANRIDRQRKEGRRKIILITSTGRQEGKTMFAVNLSCALAQKGRKTVLFDCNWANPSVSSFFGGNGMCIEDCLKGTCTVEEVLFRDKRHGIYVAGTDGTCTSIPSSTVLLKKMIQDCSEAVDYVILDTAAMNESIDAEVLAYIADQSILVISQDESKVEAIRESVWKLKESSSDFAGYILNKWEDRI